MVIEPVFEKKFLKHSHGFRPRKGTKTALREIRKTFTSTKWFIKLDIAKGFDTLDHKLIIHFVDQEISDPLLHQTLHKFLKAGYIYRDD